MSTTDNIIKVAVIGPESTGKTKLCEILAQHFNAAHTKEFARTFLETRNNVYVKEDLLEMAKGQIALEQIALKKIQENNKHATDGPLEPSIVFCDTDLNVIRIWSEIVFNTCDNKILSLICENDYDLYLLCKPDIAWVYDAQREHPEPKMRDRIYHHYRDMLIFQNKPWMEIFGNYKDRMENAKTAVNAFIKKLSTPEYFNQ